MKTAVQIQNLHYSYPGASVPVLDGITLSIRRNETFGIIGPTGAGKSTLVLHLNGILTGSGEIRICDLPMHKSNLVKIRGKIGIVFQNPDNQLFCPTVLEDIAFGLVQRGDPPEQVDHQVQNTLQTFDLKEYAGRSSYQLSQGEKKRVAIAAIMSMTPDIICFDEPFANLDYRSVYRIIREIRALTITRIIVSQDVLLTMAVCDRIALLDQGKIVCVDTPAAITRNHCDLLKASGLDYRPYLDLIGEFK